MQIKRRQPKRKIIIFLLGTLIIVAVGVAYYLYLYPTSSDDGINYDQPTDGQVDAGIQAKKNTVEQDKNDSTAADFNPRIVSASVQSKTLVIRSTIDGVHQEGSCKLTLTKGAQTVEKSADIQALPQSSACMGFDVPVSELSPGTWQITLTVTIQSQTSRVSTSVEVS